MAGIMIEVSGKRAVERRLERLAAAGALTPAFRDIGEALLNSTRALRAPSRTRRPPVGAPLARIRPPQAPQQEPDIDPVRGELQGSSRYVAGADSVAVGTNEAYGSPHRFGDDNRNIPARPFLGLSDADDVLDIGENHLRCAASR